VNRRAKKKTAAASKQRGAAKASTPGLARLKQKYGAAAIENLARAHPGHVAEHIAWCDALDQNFTKLWLDFAYGGMAGRGILDERTRCLVLVGQFLVMEEMGELPLHIRNALRHATPREVLEVILQAAVYLGYPKIVRATRVFTKTLKELGRLREITETQLPIDGHKRGRSLAAERKTWGVTESDFPRREEMLRTFGWEGLSTGSPASKKASRRWAAKLANASARSTTDGLAAMTSTRSPCSSHVRAVAGPMAAMTVDECGFPAMPTRLRTVEEEVKTTASNLPVLIASRTGAGGGVARTVRYAVTSSTSQPRAWRPSARVSVAMSAHSRTRSKTSFLNRAA